MSRTIPLTSARIRFDLRSMTASLVTGAADALGAWKDQSSADIDIFHAFAIACRDLPEDQKFFFVKDLVVCELPNIPDWYYKDDLPILQYNGVRYKVVRTRDEAKAILREMLNGMLVDIDNPTGYPPKTWHGDRVPRGL